MTSRTYHQNCSLAFGADLLGDRWTLLILRELMIQPCKFGQLVEYLAGIGTNLLAKRLKALETTGLIGKSDPANKRSAYRLTAEGWTVEPLILEFIRWGYRHGAPNPDNMHCDHWDLLALRAFFSKARCKKPLTVQFESDALTAWVRISPDGFDHQLGRAAVADLELQGSIAEFNHDVSAGHYENDPQVKSFISSFDVPERHSTTRN